MIRDLQGWTSRKQKSCGAGYETNTLPGNMSTLYNDDDPFAVCLVHNSIVKINSGNFKNIGTGG